MKLQTPTVVVLRRARTLKRMILELGKPRKIEILVMIKGSRNGDSVKLPTPTAVVPRRVRTPKTVVLGLSEPQKMVFSEMIRGREMVTR